MDSISVKAPQDTILDLPQERITGDILRGRGPRRGNLEDLLKYWRPIMRQPGGFRRCLTILADHPELYPLPNICAWLHHETTGKWPNEGCHHPGMRNCRKGARVVIGAGNKSVAREVPILSNTYRETLRLARENGSALFRPLNGDRNLIDFKARGFLFKSTWGSFLVPGEKPFFMHHNPARAVAYNLLTPGGGGIVPGMGFGFPGGGVGGLGVGSIGAGGLGGVGAGGIAGPAGSSPRCPGGFEFGGRFTDRKNSNCGARLFTPTGGSLRTVGSVGGPQYQVMGQDPMLPTMVGSEGTRVPPGRLRTVGAQRTTIGDTGPKYQDIARVGPSNAGLQEEAVSAISEALSQQRENPGFPINRLVRKDGTVLTPLVTTDILARQPANTDMEGGVFVTWVADPESMGKSEVPLLARGVRSIVFSIPGGGQIRMDRKGILTDNDLARLGQLLAAQGSEKMARGERLERLADLSQGKLALSVKYPELANPQEKVLVEDFNGGLRRVSMWVFKAFLSEFAPARPSSKPAYRLAEKGLKVHPALSEIDAKAARFGGFLSEARGQVQKKVLRTPPPLGVR